MSDRAEIITGELLRAWPISSADEDGGKQARGSVLVLGGAVDTPGAVELSGLAALRAGAGRLTVATVDATAVALAVAVPEAAVVGLPTTPRGTLGAEAVDQALGLLSSADAVLVGPGMRHAEDSREFVGGVLAGLEPATFLVLDAMGLTCGAHRACPDWATLRAVVTPNATEADYLLDRDTDGSEPAEVARDLAASLESTVAFSSHVAASDGRCWVDGGGNKGLGTSGSGDVLAGIVAGLGARGAAPEQAAAWAVHLHAQAGERLSEQLGNLGYLARELLPVLPPLMRQLDS